MHSTMLRRSLILVTGAALALGPVSVAHAAPAYKAPWPCQQHRDYYHHSSEVSNAIDYNIAGAGDHGTPALASAGGTVTAAGPNGGYGNEVVIDHGGGSSTRYAHLASIDVQVGQQVGPGHRIGGVGSTGNSTGPHLHFEQLQNGNRVPITIDGVAMNYDGQTHGHVSGNC